MYDLGRTYTYVGVAIPLCARPIVLCRLWLVVEDLMKEAHEKTGDDEPKWITVMFFLGFLLPIILDRFE